VHITTPPQLILNSEALPAGGLYVYVEKPFTLCEDDARKLIALANAKNLKLTAGMMINSATQPDG